MSKISSLFLRLGLGIVFLVFGIGKFTNDIWAKTIRALPIYSFFGSTDILIYAIGALEVVTAVCLILNFKVKLFAAIASLELIAILVMLKFTETRDIGLLGASLALFFMSDGSIVNDLNLNQIRKLWIFRKTKQKETPQWTKK